MLCLLSLSFLSFSPGLTPAFSRCLLCRSFPVPFHPSFLLCPAVLRLTPSLCFPICFLPCSSPLTLSPPTLCGISCLPVSFPCVFPGPFPLAGPCLFIVCLVCLINVWIGLILRQHHISSLLCVASRCYHTQSARTVSQVWQQVCSGKILSIGDWVYSLKETSYLLANFMVFRCRGKRGWKRWHAQGQHKGVMGVPYPYQVISPGYSVVLGQTPEVCSMFCLTF